MNYTDIPIPSTREEAIAALVELDVKKWGEAEREASYSLHCRRSYGLALNSLAHRPEYEYGDLVPHLVAAAKKALTSADRYFLNNGG